MHKKPELRKQNPQISFSVVPETIEELTKLLRNHPFFIEQYKKGHTPDASKFLRVASCLLTKTLQTKNQKGIAIMNVLFEKSCDSDLLYNCLKDTMEMEVAEDT